MRAGKVEGMMNKTSIVLLLASVLLVTGSLVGCVGTNPTPTPPPTPTPQPPPKPIPSPASTKEVAVGETFTITLYSNPSTGYQWSENAQISDQSVLEQVGHKFVYPQSETPLPPGTPGQEVWTFKTVNKGTTKVSMEYSRPWESGEKGIPTFELIVVVE